MIYKNSIYFFNLVLFFFLYSCQTPEPPFNRDYNNFLGFVKLVGPDRLSHAYNHSLLKMERNNSDCVPDCPAIDVWQYLFKDSNGKIITDSKPISTRKEHWKIKDEARLISLTLYGKKPEYVDGLVDFLESFKYIKEVNQIKEETWGYESFTIRIYTPKRHPDRLEKMGEIKNEVPKDLLNKLLDLGCEIVYVDNKLPKAGRDATFWRFLVFNEPMPEGQRVRYLIRDVDWLLTSAEVLAVGEWMYSGYDYHRMHILPLCIGPLTASIWGGTHVGNNFSSSIHKQMEYYPYRNVYGDDELFTRDIIWPQMLATGSVMTHLYKRGFISSIVMPYENSCDEPTKDACGRIIKDNRCVDVLMPNDVPFPYTEIGMRQSFDDVKSISEAFAFSNQSKRFDDALCAMSKKCWESNYNYKGLYNKAVTTDN